MISLGEALDRVAVERFGKQVTDLIEKCIVVLFWCPSLIVFLGGHLLAQYWNSGFVDITMVMLFLEVYLGITITCLLVWIDRYGSCAIFLNI